MQTKDLISKAIGIAGSQARLAKLIGVTQPNVHRLASGRQSISLELAMRVEQATAGAVAAEELRPDLASLIRQWREAPPEQPAGSEEKSAV